MADDIGDGRQWYPTHYCDEIVPAHRKSAQAWVEKHGDGWRIAPFDKEHEYDHGIRLADGQVVNFASVDRLGVATLTIASDGTWSVDRDPPAGTTTINCDHDGAIADDLDGIIAQLKEFEIFEEGECDLSYSEWRFEDFRFDAATGTLTLAADTSVQ